MKSFRDYENLIRENVKKISDEDPNWNFTVKSIGKYKVRIRWTYLDGEKDNCFILKLRDADPEYNDMFLSVRDPQDNMFTGHIVSDNEERRFWQDSYEKGIKSAIREIAEYAHKYY